MDATKPMPFAVMAIFQGKHIVQFTDGKREPVNDLELKALEKDPSFERVDTNTFLNLITRVVQSVRHGKGDSVSTLAIEALTTRNEKLEERVKNLEGMIAKLLDKK